MYSLIIIVFCVLIYYILNHLRKTKLPPGPIAFPLIGNRYLIRKYCKKYGGLSNALLELCNIYDSNIIGLNLNGFYTVIVQGNELIDEIFTRDEFLGRPNSFFIRLRSLNTCKGITMTDGPFWQKQRSFVMRQLHKLGFGKEPMECLMKNEIQTFLRRISDGSNVSLKLAISRCTINVLWVLVAGTTFEREEVLVDLLSLMNERSKAFDLAGGTLSQYPWLRFIAPEATGYTLIQKLNAKLKTIITRIIEEHKSTYSKDTTRDFIDAFLHEMYGSDGPSTTFTDDQLIMVCFDFFIAGALTISSSLDFLMLHMLMHPDMQQMAYEEVSKSLQPKQLSSLVLKSQMPFVKAFILEAERYTPIVPLIGPRRVLRHTTLGGYALPKDTTVIINCLKSYYDKKNWKNPEVFMPSRFLNSNGTEDKKLYTFSKGKRSCPGINLAQGFIFLFLTSFLNHFQITNPEGKPAATLNFVPGIIISPKPYDVKLIPRQ